MYCTTKYNIINKNLVLLKYRKKLQQSPITTCLFHPFSWSYVLGVPCNWALVDSHRSSSCSQLLSFGLARGKLSLKHSSITAFSCQNCKASATFSSLVCVALPKVILNRARTRDTGYRTPISHAYMLSERTHTHGMPWSYGLIRISEVVGWPSALPQPLQLDSVPLLERHPHMAWKTAGIMKWASWAALCHT